MKIQNFQMGMASKRTFKSEKVTVARKKQSAGKVEEKNIQRTGYTGDGYKKITTMEELRAALLEQILFGLHNRKYIGSTERYTGNIIESGGYYVRETSYNEYYKEEEKLSFSSVGSVTTEDGRSFNFDISFKMSRNYEASLGSYEKREYVVCDPLVLSFDGDVAELENSSFEFDLDCDGCKENVKYFAGKSGFLALDKNEDGIINDGSELFGTASGDGFKDLAEYDDDNNGWIDENDAIFNKLKIFSMNRDGTQSVKNLNEAGVGAIFLGNVSSRYALNDPYSNESNGFISKSGVFLMENGNAGLVQHVDFTV